MRIWLEGGDPADRGAIARALRSGGITVARRPARIDLRLRIRRVETAALLLDPVAGIATLDGRKLRLTRRELAILAVLAARGPLDRAGLLAHVWGHVHDPGTNLVAVHVSRLRAKLGAGVIASEGGRYRLAVRAARVDSPQPRP